MPLGCPHPQCGELWFWDKYFCEKHLVICPKKDCKNPTLKGLPCSWCDKNNYKKALAESLETCTGTYRTLCGSAIKKWIVRTCNSKKMKGEQCIECQKHKLMEQEEKVKYTKEKPNLIKKEIDGIVCAIECTIKERDNYVEHHNNILEEFQRQLEDLKKELVDAQTEVV